MKEKILNTEEHKEHYKLNQPLFWLMCKYENAIDRAEEAENLLLEIANMKWYKRIFIRNKIKTFIKQ